MTATRKQRNPIVGLLTSPWSLLVSLAVAVMIGLMYKNVAAILKPFGLMYLYLIEMTVIPIIISAIVSGVAGLVKSSGMWRFLVRMIVVFVIMLAVASILGTLGGVIGRPGAGLDAKTRNALGSIATTQENQNALELGTRLMLPADQKPKPGFADSIAQIIPRNIFSALSSGRVLALILFSIVFGIAIGALRGEHGDSLMGLFDGLFKAFQKIIAGLMVALPFGLICLLADQVASTGLRTLLAMVKFILIFCIVGVVVFLLDLIIIWRRSHLRLGAVLKALLEPILVSLVTRSSFATLPTAIRSMEQKLGFYERSTRLFLPLGTTFGKFGNIIYFAIAALFVAQLYGVNMDYSRYGIVAVGSVLAGVATAGASGIATLGLLSIVVRPLGLALGGVLAILIAIDVVAGPLRTVLIVLTNMAANAIIAPRVDMLERGHAEDRGRRRRATGQRDLIAQIRTRGVLIAVAARRSLPPLYEKRDDGILAGVAVDCLLRVAAALGVKLKIELRPDSLSGLITYLKRGRADVFIGDGNFDSAYGDELAYSVPYASSEDAVLIPKDTIATFRTAGKGGKASFLTFSGTLGVLSRSVQAMVSGRVFPAATVRFFEEPDEMVDAVIAGSIRAAFASEIELRYWMAKRSVSAGDLTCVGFTNRPVEFRLAVTPDHRTALKRLNGIIGGRGVQPRKGAGTQ